MHRNLAEREGHMELLDTLLGEKAKNRETLFDYDFGRDTRPATLSSGREFFRVEITTLNNNHNPVRFNWFYHSDLKRERWFMTSLSLRGLGLDVINTSVLSDFTRLEYLDFQGNNIEEFTLKHVKNCNKLHSLNISSNSLTMIDNNDFQYLPNLRYINLFNNNIEFFDLKPLINCPALNRIILSNNKLRKIDLRPLNKLEYLINLDLSHNLLVKIDISLRNERLQSLILNDNLLEEIRITSNHKLPRLSVINLSNNNLKNINLMDFLAFPNLQRILLWGNELKEGFMITDENSTLEEINLNSNNIKKFAMRGKFLALIELELAYNNIKELDLTGVELPELKYLNLSCNPLTELKLPKLQLMKNIDKIDLLGTDIDRLILKGDYDQINSEEDQIGKFKFKECKIKISEERHLTIIIPLKTTISND